MITLVGNATGRLDRTATRSGQNASRPKNVVYISKPKRDRVVVISKRE